MSSIPSSSPAVLRFQQVDVFTATPCLGNPLAVVIGADALDDEAMGRFARWTNLSETTFLLNPTQAGADYRVRIFMASGAELPFAGHPTLGSCHAWLASGGKPATGDHVVQQCGVGLVTLKRLGQGQLAFAAPPLSQEEVQPSLVERACGWLDLPRERVKAARWLINGPRFLGLLLQDANDVLAARPCLAEIAAADVQIGLIGAHREGRGSAVAPDFEVRAFAPAHGVPEDPVTGSLNAALAQWLIPTGHVPNRYVAAQGTALGRRGRVFITQDDTGAVWVGGHSTTCIDGTLHL